MNRSRIERKKRSTPPPSNPFDSDCYSASDVSRPTTSKGGVSFNLDTIAASRRAMISGKAPTNVPAEDLATRIANINRPSDLENGDVRTSRKQGQLDVEDRGNLDEANDSGSSSGSGSGSDDDDDDDSRYDSIDNVKERRKPYVYAVLGLISLMLLGVIIALSVVIFGGTSGDKSAMPILTARQESLHNIIKTVVPFELLTNAESPQYRAHQWLLYEDSLGLAPASGVSQDRVVQRYALAVFFFSTGGPRTWKSHNWLDGDECAEEWDGVGCTNDGFVHIVSLNNFGLAGSIPAQVGLLSRLEHFILKNNAELVGFLPKELGGLQGLHQLGVYNNNVEGTIPDELFQATNLRFINLQNNNLSGQISQKIEALEKLETLVLMNNKLSGEVPFGSLSSAKVKFLGLSHNNLSGSITPMVGVLDHAEYLYLDGNTFGGELPIAISQLTNLKSLNLDQNDFQGEIPTDLGDLTLLEFLSMQSNGFEGVIPAEMALMTNLNNLNMAQNAFIGPIPNLSSLKDLRNLMLYHNKLTGYIPTTLFSLVNLETLFLSSNQLTGNVPSEITNLKGQLRGLYLSDNQLDGEIPTALCDLQQLEALMIDDNAFQGAIPACLGNLQQLKQMYVFKNQLSGAIPTKLTELSWLTGLGLEENNFRGDVPLEICSFKDNDSNFDLWADCGGSFPDLLCPCCSACCPSAECE